MSCFASVLRLVDCSFCSLGSHMPRRYEDMEENAEMPITKPYSKFDGFFLRERQDKVYFIKCFFSYTQTELRIYKKN